MVLALAIKAFQTYNKVKVLKDTIDLLSKKKVDKLDKVLSYIPSIPGKLGRFCKKASDNTKEMNLRILRNQTALKDIYKQMNHATSTRSMHYLEANEKRYLKNIAKAQNNRDRFVINEIKKSVKTKLKHLIPGRSIVMSQKALADAIYNKEGWKKIAIKFGSAMSHLGMSEFSRCINAINKVGSIHLTANGFWKSISINHNYNFPIIDSSGASKIMKIQMYKNELTEKLWDRTFYFVAHSPETGNFSQDLHSYDCNSEIYTIPIRGWYGTKVKKYKFENVKLNSVIAIVLQKLDAGHNYWNNYATAEAIKWIPIYASNWEKKKKK